MRFPSRRERGCSRGATSSGTRSRTMRRIICLLPALLLMVSCSGPTISAVGESDDLVIVTAGGASDRLVRTAVGVAEQPVAWLLDEPVFASTVRTLDQIKRVTNRRHLLLVGTWEDELGAFAERRFEGLERGAPPEFVIATDVWAEGQVAAAVVGPDEKSVVAFLKERAAGIILEIELVSERRLARNLCSTGEADRRAAALIERFGWSLCLPDQYELFTTQEGEPFAFFRRTRPDRTVFVAWRQGDAADVTEDAATAWRQELSVKYLDGDEIERRRPFSAETARLAGRRAVRLRGWWANTELVGGGPFVSYCFAVPEQGRVYLVDASLFAPSFDKTALMRNLEAIVRTFRTGD
ncbi:MAG: DUF4837 family protein [Candidatus Eisenbacteria bacterium]|nr:DUF4837 family protein [Candidatus Eisenbacteria bacterium]